MKIARDQRALFGIAATGVDEGKDDRLAAEVGEVEPAPELIDESGRRHSVADVQRMYGAQDAPRRRRRRLWQDANVFEHQRVGMLLEERDDTVARMQRSGIDVRREPEQRRLRGLRTESVAAHDDLAVLCHDTEHQSVDAFRVS